MPGPYYSHRPRRPGRARTRLGPLTKRRAPMRNPPGVSLHPHTKAAIAIQRNFRRNRRLKYNKEVKTMTELGSVNTLQKQAASATQMANGVLIYPVPFNAAHHTFAAGVSSDSQVIGGWLTPQYLTQKFVVNWASLTHHSDLNLGLELRCRYGYITVTAQKANIDLDSNWQTNVNKMVCRELQESGIDDNHLVFSKKSRTVKILGDFMVRPSLNRRPVVYQKDDEDADSSNAMFAPPNNLTIKWDKKKMFSKQKRRVSNIASTTTYVLHNSWVPFVYFSADNITTNMGSLDIHSSSKFYYSDS